MMNPIDYMIQTLMMTMTMEYVKIIIGYINMIFIYIHRRIINTKIYRRMIREDVKMRIQMVTMIITDKYNTIINPTTYGKMIMTYIEGKQEEMKIDIIKKYYVIVEMMNEITLEREVIKFPDFNLCMNKEYEIEGIKFKFRPTNTNLTNANVKMIDIIIISEKNEKIKEFLEKVSENYKRIKTDKISRQIKTMTTSTQGISKYEINYSRTKIDRSQTFEHIFGEAKKVIMKKLERIQDIEYHKKFGLKRKVSMILQGKPGCGKTCMISAIANYTGRSIMKIDLSRVKTNSELFQMIFVDTISDGYKTSYDDWIIIFDEFDSIMNVNLNKKNNENQTNKKIILDDKLDVGYILSILDGAYDQDGMILIATVNTIEKIDPGFYRNGRFELINIEYFNRDEIKEIIEKYYNTKLSESQIKSIRNDKKIENLTIKHFCTEYVTENKSINELINKINDIDEKIQIENSLL